MISVFMLCLRGSSLFILAYFSWIVFISGCIACIFFCEASSSA